MVNNLWSPYTISFGGLTIAVDLGAEKLIGTIKDNQKIAVEIKSFLEKSSAISQFHKALGQFINYWAVLKRKESERILYLAIPSFTYDSFFSLEFPQLMIKENNLKLIIFEPQKEVILAWINFKKYFQLVKEILTEYSQYKPVNNQLEIETILVWLKLLSLWSTKFWLINKN